VIGKAENYQLVLFYAIEFSMFITVYPLAYLLPDGHLLMVFAQQIPELGYIREPCQKIKNRL